MLTSPKYNSIENTYDRKRVIRLFQQIKRQPALFVTPDIQRSALPEKSEQKIPNRHINKQAAGLIKGSDSGRKNDNY